MGAKPHKTCGPLDGPGLTQRNGASAGLGREIHDMSQLKRSPPGRKETQGPGRGVSKLRSQTRSWFRPEQSPGPIRVHIPLDTAG